MVSSRLWPSGAGQVSCSEHLTGKAHLFISPWEKEDIQKGQPCRLHLELS